MTTQDKLIALYGNPMVDQLAFEKSFMTWFDIPSIINNHVPALPNKLYCHKELVLPLTNVLTDLIKSSWLYGQIKTYDGCFNVRYVRGSRTVVSVHSFGLAIDLNASQNPLGLSTDEALLRGLKPFDKMFFEVWRSHGFTCGIDFKRPDGMHFQYTKNL